MSKTLRQLRAGQSPRRIKHANWSKRKTYKMALEKANFRAAHWNAKAMDYACARFSKLSVQDANTLKALLGRRAYAGSVLASDLAARRKFELLCAKLGRRLARASTRGDWYHVTLSDDEFIVMERTPKLALRKLKRKAYKELQELRLEGLVWVDVHPVTNWPGQGKGSAYLFHVHAMMRAGKGFRLRNAKRALKASRSWGSNAFQAKPATIKRIDEAKGCLSYWFGYDAKCPTAKRAIKRANGKWELAPTQKDVRGQLAMRLVEGLSHIHLSELIFSVGKSGAALRVDVLRQLKLWHSARWLGDKRCPIRSDDAFFQRVWATTKVKRYAPWRIE